MSKKKRERSSNLSDTDIARIVGILDGWGGKITWDLLILEMKLWFHGQEYTRQTLGKHPRIKKAYDLARQRWRNARDNAMDSASLTPKASSEEMALLMEDNSKLKAENRRLKEKNNDLLEQLARRQYNADITGEKESKSVQEFPASKDENGVT